MRPRLAVFRNGSIATDFWYKDELDSKTQRRFLVFCYGLPSHPYQHNPAKVEKYIEDNYVLVYPHYIGTWASDGVMSWENCVRTVIDTIRFIKEGYCKSAYDLSEHYWKAADISLVGGSFGASIVLVAGAKSTDIRKIIAVAGPTDWKDHSRIPEELAEPIDDLYQSVMRGWGKLWRIPSKKEWNRLVTGEADINPIDYIEVLKEKDVMLIHGKKDDCVSVKRSVELHKMLCKGSGNHELLVLDSCGHLGNDIVGQDCCITKVLDFLSP